jgi:hypothetical protein
VDGKFPDRELGLDEVGGEISQALVETPREKPIDAVDPDPRHRGEDHTVGQLGDGTGRRTERDVPDLGEGGAGARVLEIPREILRKETQEGIHVRLGEEKAGHPLDGAAQIDEHPRHADVAREQSARQLTDGDAPSLRRLHPDRPSHEGGERGRRVARADVPELLKSMSVAHESSSTR